jgi:protein TonB
MHKADNTIYSVVEIQPKFPGGEAAFSRFLLNRIHYPEKDKENLADSRCFIQFIVEKNGTLANFEMLKGSKAVFD